MIEALQRELLKRNDKTGVRTSHMFCDGCYAREIFIPAGVVIVGAKHKTEHFHVISQGKCAVSNMGEAKVYEAPYTGVTKAGSKRAIIAIDDTVFTTFHPTNETDINKIEQQVIEDEGLKIANNPVERIE